MVVVTMGLIVVLTKDSNREQNGVNTMMKTALKNCDIEKQKVKP
jgi:hypothetical protein